MDKKYTKLSINNQRNTLKKNSLIQQKIQFQWQDKKNSIESIQIKIYSVNNELIEENHFINIKSFGGIYNDDIIFKELNMKTKINSIVKQIKKFRNIQLDNIDCVFKTFKIYAHTNGQEIMSQKVVENLTTKCIFQQKENYESSRTNHIDL